MTFTFDAGISLEEYTGLFVSKERLILRLPSPADAVIGKPGFFFKQ